MKSTKKIKVKEVKERILYWDIETSYNLVWSWQLGNRISLGPDNLIKERAIITIAYKFSDQKKVYTLSWNKGNDKELCKKFSKVLEQADYICAHNGDSYDSKFFMGRCLYHGIPVKGNPKKIDTLKIARRLFRLNSNKLDYLGKFLGLGQKRDTGGLKTWTDIIMYNNQSALKKMITYNVGDVLLLERIHKKLNKYVIKKKK